MLLQQQKHVHIFHSYLSAPLCLFWNTVRLACKFLILNSFIEFIPYGGTHEDIVMELTMDAGTPTTLKFFVMLLT